MEDFKKFAKGNGVNGNGLDKYITQMGYINPTILEERQLNVTQMDVFSRLMMERIIFLGTGIDADVANIVNAQMLYLSSLSDEDITLNINSPGGEVYSGLATQPEQKGNLVFVNRYYGGTAKTSENIEDAKIYYSPYDAQEEWKDRMGDAKITRQQLLL